MTGAERFRRAQCPAQNTALGWVIHPGVTMAAE